MRNGILAATVLGAAIVVGVNHDRLLGAEPTAEAAPALPSIPVSVPLKRELEARRGFLGQFSATERVEIRAQVGGTLTAIHFKDGSIVKKGDPLFTIDPTPYEIKLSQANAQLETATSRLVLADRELARATALKVSNAGSAQSVDQKTAEQAAAKAAVNEATALIRDAKFDLDRCTIAAPFTGRIGSHLASVGNLISGSRAGTGATTLLATMVSLDPIYLNFDMSESEYLSFSRHRDVKSSALTDKVSVALSDEKSFVHEGTLDFVDNALDSSSGTIHARATIPNKDLLLTPGAFGRVRLALTAPQQTLLVPDASVVPDQSTHMVMTVGTDGKVIAKQVEVGDLRGGLRVIRSGLDATEKVVVDGMTMAIPGSMVSPVDGKIEFNAAQD